MKVDLIEVNVVRATDGTFIVRTVTEQGINEITTSPDFGGLTSRLSDILLVTPAVASQQQAPSAVQ